MIGRSGFGNSDGKVEKAEWDKAFGSFLNKGGLSCVEWSQRDGMLECKVAWKYTKTTPYIPSVLVIPTIQAGRLYIRTETQLYCFGSKA